MVTRFFYRIFLSKAIILLPAFMLIGCGGLGLRLSEPLPEVEHGMQAKTLAPRPGKALVYFHYNRKALGSSVEISLDGATSTLDKDTFVVWEVEPGEHELIFARKKLLGREAVAKKILCEPDRTYYYNSYMNTDSRSDTHYAFREATVSEGETRIQDFALMAWFRDGQEVFRRTLESTPEDAEEPAETTESAATPEPETTEEATEELPPVPEAGSETAVVEEDVAAPEVETAPVAVQGRSYALVVGISKYQHLGILPTAVNDAQAVADALQEYTFEVTVFLDDNATREHILERLETLQQQLEPEDKFLLYYAGRSILDAESQNAYWQPVEAKEDSMTQWIIADSITAALKRMPARQILVVADSVFSGTLTRASQAELTDKTARQRYLKKIAEQRSRLILTSGANEPSAAIADTGLSLFASAVVKGLRLREQTLFTAEELFREHILEFVAGQSSQLPEFKAIRNSGHEGGDFMFLRK